MKVNKKIIIISIILIVGIALGIICFKLKNTFSKNEEKEVYNESSYFDEYIEKVNKFNEIFSEVDFSSLPINEDDPSFEGRCTTLSDDIVNKYIDTFENLYRETYSNFIELYAGLPDKKTKERKKHIDLCKPLNCDITPISKDLYHYKEEDGKKYLDIGEEGNVTTYELIEKDGKLISVMPIIYCPSYSIVE